MSVKKIMHVIKRLQRSRLHPDLQNIYGMIGIAALLGLTACGQTEVSDRTGFETEQASSELLVLDTEIYEEVQKDQGDVSYIVKEGDTLESRIRVPEGYVRISAEEEPFIEDSSVSPHTYHEYFVDHRLMGNRLLSLADCLTVAVSRLYRA